MENFYEQYRILPMAPSQRNHIKHKREKYDKQKDLEQKNIKQKSVKEENPQVNSVYYSVDNQHNMISL